jgi:polyisoprenoid-binding protein YceI
MKRLLLLLLMPCFVQAQSDASLPAAVGELSWRSMPTVAREHTGTIQISKGGITFEHSGKVVKGTIELDMRSIKSLNTESGASAKDFEERMRSADFFSTADFPNATISFVGKRYDLNPFEKNRFGITLSVTVKGNSDTLNLPATITMSDKGKLILKATVPMNRAKQDTQQASVFSFMSLKDEVVANELEIIITIDIKAAGSGC